MKEISNNLNENEKQTLKGLKHWLQQPRSKITEREWNALRWRWEFLRLNEDYQKKYKDVESSGKSKVLPQYNEWGIGEWFDPELSFEELYNKTREQILELEIPNLDVDEAAKSLLFISWEKPSSNVALCPVFTSEVVLDLNLDAPDAENIAKFRKWLNKIKSQKKKKLPWDWNMLPFYHKAIMLRKQGKSAKEIAEIMFPEPDPYSDDESYLDLDLDSVMRRIFRYLDAGKNLVEGGYKNIK